MLQLSIQAIPITVYFIGTDPVHAQLAVLSRADKNTIVTVIHEGIDDCSTWDLVGTEPTSTMTVMSAESITLLARVAGQIVASQVLEVEAWNAEEGYVLRPCAGNGFLVMQVPVNGSLSDIPELRPLTDEETTIMPAVHYENVLATINDVKVPAEAALDVVESMLEQLREREG